ncbi:hypothetical protein [Paenarthrobacter sp. FR1]|uniref:hypothetical protein n=1 Tax=Paenarthrobacter sp. FR1 TaxID=3439548 RepID=UPI003DA55827
MQVTHIRKGRATDDLPEFLPDRLCRGGVAVVLVLPEPGHLSGGGWEHRHDALMDAGLPTFRHASIHGDERRGVELGKTVTVVGETLQVNTAAACMSER